jgi:signal transduction histidine kinase
VLLLGVVGGSAGLAARSAQQAVRRQVEAQLRQVAHTLAAGDFPFTDRVLAQVADLSGAEYLLHAADGRTLSTLRGRPVELPAPDAPPVERDDLRLVPGATVGGEPYLAATVRLRRGPDGGEDTLHILYPEARWRDALWEALRPALVLGVAGSLGSVGLALGIAHWLARRVHSLEQRTRLVAGGDFRPVPLPRWDDELRDLAVSINEMAGRLARLHDAARKAERLKLLGQVGGGLAHQLRNGVAGARLAVQVHAKECTGADPEPLDVALRQLALVEEKLRRFLRLGDHGRPDLRPCDLAGLVSEAVALVRPRCRHTRVELRWRPPEVPLVVLGDAGQLGELLLNVLGSAVEAAGPGGWVEVRAHSSPLAPALRGEGPGVRGGSAQSPSPPTLSPEAGARGENGALALIEVLDSGPGPPPAVADRLFEEFVTSKPDGVGLGLAVARQVAEAHGGHIDCQPGPRPTCFQIVLPLAPAPPCPD